MIPFIKEYFGSLAGMSAREQAGTVLGILLIIVSAIIYISSKRNRILLLRLANDVLYGANNFCFANYTAGVLGIVGCFREIIFYYRGKKKWAESRIWLAIFMAIAFLTPCIQWAVQRKVDLLQLLSAFGTAFLVVGLFCSDTVKMKALVIVGQILYLIYQITSGNVTAAVCAVMSIISCIVGLINEYVSRRAGDDGVNRTSKRNQNC